MTVTDWRSAVIADAGRRGLSGLEPLIAALAQAVSVLRAADWNDSAAGAPATPPPDAR